MEERSSFLFKLAAVLAVIGVIIAVIVYFVVRGSMEDIKSLIMTGKILHSYLQTEPR